MIRTAANTDGTYGRAGQHPGARTHFKRAAHTKLAAQGS